MIQDAIYRKKGGKRGWFKLIENRGNIATIYLIKETKGFLLGSCYGVSMEQFVK
jgi:hypothetical protein